MSNSPVIAVVDDDKSIREALSDLLQVLGLSCRSFDRAEAFLAAYAPGVFACVITDIRMPGIGGLELLRRVKALDAAMPILVVTASTDAVTHARAREDGAMACLTKPIKGEELMRHLAATRGDARAGEDEAAGAR